MSDTEELPEDKPFAVERAKQGRATCKHCKQKCIQGELRLAKLVPNPFGDGKMKSWFHINCMFEQFMKQRQTTKRIEDSQDVEGWDQLSEDDKNILLSNIVSCDKAFEAKYGVKVKKSPKTITKRNFNSSQKKLDTASSTGSKERVHLLFKEFRRLIADISNVNSYLDKTKIVNTVFMKGRNGNGFKGDITLWCKLLLPGVVKRVYNLQSKQLIKIFSKLFNSDLDDMLEHLEQGDIGETIQHFFENSRLLKPAKKSLLTVNEVDSFLEHLTTLTKEEEQTNHFKSFVTKCTSNDLKTVIRLIKHDLRMNAGAKHILDGVHPDAYQAYQSSRDIDSVISRCLGDSKDDKKKTVEATINVMTPVLPMLAEACKSVEQAMKKCPNGMYSEIKYDGERVQVHKQGTEFKYFSRSLKPVMPHKVAHFRDYIPKAFPSGHDLILDSEILMIDTVTGKPLPFGTLGKHKKKELEDASVCLFVFDCIYYNGEDLTSKPITHRKKILLNNMIEIPNHIVFSEIETIHKPEDLTNMIAKVLKLGLEGLVLKGLMSTYEPGKRHWLKVKKDYLFDGAMADSADLIVLGAWYGTGKKGGKMSVFLMGCFDQNKNKFCTVTKVHTGHDDKTLEKLQTELDMNKISCDPSKVPSWLHCTKTMIPDFVAKDPKNQPVWEITGAEFTQHDVHTANGISIRFPRVTKIRNDKDWKSATSVEELSILYKKSKEHTDVSLLMKTLDNRDDNSVSSSSTSSSKNVTPTKPKNEENEILAYAGHKNILQKRKHSGSPKSKNKKLKEDESANFEATGSNVDENDILKPRKMQKNSADEITSTQQKFEHLHRQSSKKKLKKDEEDNRSKKFSYRINGQIHKPLPNYFANINLLIDNAQNNQNHIKWIRYFVAYGGTLLNSSQHSEATHILHSKNTISEPSIIYPHTVRHITFEWIKDSVTLGYLQPCTEYTVFWKPS